MAIFESLREQMNDPKIVKSLPTLHDNVEFSFGPNPLEPGVVSWSVTTASDKRTVSGQTEGFYDATTEFKAAVDEAVDRVFRAGNREGCECSNCKARRGEA